MSLSFADRVDLAVEHLHVLRDRRSLTESDLYDVADLWTTDLSLPGEQAHPDWEALVSVLESFATLGL